MADPAGAAIAHLAAVRGAMLSREEAQAVAQAVIHFASVFVASVNLGDLPEARLLPNILPGALDRPREV
jgi:hypothetical protein